MGKKLFLNIFYNVVIFLCLITGYEYGIAQKNYIYLIGAAAIIAIFIVLKVRLLKEVKKAQKNP
jgi:bacteriorhodopsin